MSEELVCEMKLSEGSFKLYNDKKNKLLRGVWAGKYEDKDQKKAWEAIWNEGIKYKGELLYLHDASNSDVKLWSSKQGKIASDMFAEAAANSKKIAIVYSSFMHQKSTESFGKIPDNCKFFSSSQEAMNWLLG